MQDNRSAVTLSTIIDQVREERMEGEHHSNNTIQIIHLSICSDANGVQGYLHFLAPLGSISAVSLEVPRMLLVLLSLRNL